MRRLIYQQVLYLKIGLYKNRYLSKTVLFVFIFCQINGLLSQNSFQKEYFQQKVDYNIEASLDTTEQTLDVVANVVYYNNSKDVLDKLIFHIWLNALSDRSSDFSDQLLSMGNRDFYFSDDEQLGGYEELTFYINDTIQKFKPYNHGEKSFVDIIELPLNEKLLPNQKLELRIAYKLDIPFAFSRGGWKDDLYRMTQWYPKPAVYDSKGWHPMPYLSYGEFYSEFGDYKVQLHLPISYSVVSTGKRNESLSSLDVKSRSRKVTYEASNVHDFAWFTSDRYIPYTDPLEIEDRTIKVNLFVKENNEYWENKMTYAKRALQFFSEHIGAYPYPEMTIVESSCGSGSGMEYPMITLLDFCSDDQIVDHLIAHEIGHNWFYGILASNERRHAWIDEGLTSYYDHLYNDTYYNNHTYGKNIPFFLNHTGDNISLLEHSVIHLERIGQSMTIDQEADEFDILNYMAMNYEKTAWVFKYLSSYMGHSDFEEAVRTFYERWQFKHVYPKDFIDVINEKTVVNVNDIFTTFFNTNRPIDFAIKKVDKIEGGFNIEICNRYETSIPFHVSAYNSSNQLLSSQWYPPSNNKTIKVEFETGDVDYFVLNGEVPIFETNHSNNNYHLRKAFPKRDKLNLGLGNSIGKTERKNINLILTPLYNSYDGISVGMGVFNNIFPQSNTRFFINPNFGFASKDMIGRFAIEKDILIKKGKLRSFRFGLEGKQYHFERNESFNYDLKYRKISPYVGVNLSSGISKNTYLQYKWHHIQQEDVAFDDLGVTVNEGNKFNKHQIKLTSNTYGKLSKSRFNFLLEYEKYPRPNDETGEYLKTSFDWENDIYYNSNSKFSIRVFGAYFPINSQRQSSSYSNIFTRGSIGLSGQGNVDQSYENLFWSRNGHNGKASSQIFIKDAGFKNTFDNFFSTGMSNDYSLALNLKSDLPFKIFSVLDVKPYLDFAYVSTKAVTSDPLEGTFYYSGGLSLEIGRIAGIYLPLINSDALQLNYAGSNLLSRISVRIDFESLNPWKLSDNPVLLF